MKRYLLRRNGRITGPFSLEVLNLMEIYASDMLAAPADNIQWMPPEMIEGLDNFIIYDGEPGEIPVLPGEIPYSKNYRKAEHHDPDTEWTKKIRFRLNILRPATVFFLLIFSTIFAKLAIDSVVDHEYYRQHTLAIIKQPEQPLKYVHDALVKKYYKPSDTVALPRLAPGKPSEVFRDVSVNGKMLAANNAHPASLELKIKNSSLYLVDNAEVEVEYNNGEKIIARQSLKITELSPRSTKTIKVPLKHPNVTISYKILNIYTSQYTALTREI